ncbi:hypothetical protein VN12_04320 [Pirellula sp. SH-Sr6A]|uniref:hypothetical protein n=1 Tax=Pirellula sp. SH-Sr6A TaxID=1632865 RepID=UPI00078E09ED|nr:hypothetical protein [Pirellula sp. SH-Sr6A]AMV31318.1 hypothetical protein VN12_04320 [Pirellula sp. SH-Sr6A]
MENQMQQTVRIALQCGVLGEAGNLLSFFAKKDYLVSFLPVVEGTRMLIGGVLWEVEYSYFKPEENVQVIQLSIPNEYEDYKQRDMLDRFTGLGFYVSDDDDEWYGCEL